MLHLRHGQLASCKKDKIVTKSQHCSSVFIFSSLSGDGLSKVNGVLLNFHFSFRINLTISTTPAVICVM